MSRTPTPKTQKKKSLTLFFFLFFFLSSHSLRVVHWDILLLAWQTTVLFTFNHHLSNDDDVWCWILGSLYWSSVSDCGKVLAHFFSVDPQKFQDPGFLNYSYKRGIVRWKKKRIQHFSWRASKIFKRVGDVLTYCAHSVCVCKLYVIQSHNSRHINAN